MVTVKTRKKWKYRF